MTSTAVNSTLTFDARRWRFSRASASAARTGDSGGRFFAAGLRARGAGRVSSSNSKSSWMAGAAAGFARRAAGFRAGFGGGASAASLSDDDSGAAGFRFLAAARGGAGSASL